MPLCQESEGRFVCKLVFSGRCIDKAGVCDGPPNVTTGTGGAPPRVGKATEWKCFGDIANTVAGGGVPATLKRLSSMWYQRTRLVAQNGSPSPCQRLQPQSLPDVIHLACTVHVKIFYTETTTAVWSLLKYLVSLQSKGQTNSCTRE